MINLPDNPSTQQVFFRLATKALETVQGGDPLEAWADLQVAMATDGNLRMHSDTLYYLYLEAGGDAQAWKQGLEGIMRLL